MGAEINKGLRKAQYDGLYAAQKAVQGILEKEYNKVAKDRQKELAKEQREVITADSVA